MTIEVTQSTVRQLSQTLGKHWGISYPDFMPNMVVVHRIKWNTENIDVATLQKHLIGPPHRVEPQEEFMEMQLSDDCKYVTVWGIMDGAKWRLMTKIAQRIAKRRKAEAIIAEIEKEEQDEYWKDLYADELANDELSK